MSEPKKHHFVAASHIGFFAEPPGRNGRIHVWDNVQRKSWPSKPNNVAQEVDYYRIKGDDPLAVENMLAKVEGAAIAAIRVIDSAARQPTAEEIDPIISFVALQIVRGLELRDELAQYTVDFSRLVMEMSTKTDSAWEGTLSRLEKDDPTFRRDRLGMPTREQMAEFARSAATALNVNRDYLIATTITNQETAFKAVSDRQIWFMRLPGAEDLVTGSNPVVINPLPGSPPWLVAPGTAESIMMPLTPRLLFVAGEHLTPETKARVLEVEGPSELAPTLNVRLAMQSQQVFSRRSWHPPARSPSGAAAQGR